MDSANIYEIMLRIAKAQIENQVMNDGDYYDDEGLLVCGNCGGRRQYIDYIENPTENNPNNKSPVKLVLECACEKKREEYEKKRKRYAENMARLSKLQAQSLMDDRFKSATFKSYVINSNNQKNLNICKKYVVSFDKMLEKGQGLLMWGGVGTGKSFAAACIANALMQKYISVVMTSFVKILEIIRQGANDETTSILETIDNAQLVIFDDFGAERDTNYALEKVYNVIDGRYRDGRPMIITTNLSLQQMKDESDIRYVRIYDRIFETCYPMQFTGKSWRKQTAHDRFNEMEKFFNSDEGDK